MAGIRSATPSSVGRHVHAFAAAVGRGRLHAIWIAIALLTSTSCGYALAGRGNALPATIKIIGVPQFTNRSTIPDIDRVMGDAVRQEFQSKGKYQVRAEEGGVDGLLTATILTVTLQPTAFLDDRKPSAYAIVVVANVEFKDLTDPTNNNKIIWANPSFRISDDYQVAAGTVVDNTVLASQGAQSLERLAKKFAKDVVTSIFEAF